MNWQAIADDSMDDCGVIQVFHGSTCVAVEVFCDGRPQLQVLLQVIGWLPSTGKVLLISV